MILQAPTRRAFLASVAGTALASPAGGRIRLGGPVFLKSDDPADLAAEHRKLGYSSALCPPASIQDSAKIRGIEQAFASADVVIAEVGAWTNMVEPDTEKRRANMRYVLERMALADAVGARCCVTTAGTFTSGRGPHPDDLSEKYFDAAVENCRRVIDEVKPTRARFTIEMMSWCLPDGPDAYLRLLKAVDRKSMGVHLDPFNGINCASRYYGNAAFVSECVRKLGKWVVSCHAKDLDLLSESNIHLEEVVPGRGHVDYRTYLRELAALSQETPLILEHMKTPAEYVEGAMHIGRIAQEIGITL